MSRIPITIRLLLSYLLVAVLPLTGLSMLYTSSFETTLHTTMLGNMDAIADKKADQIDTFVEERLADARHLSHSKNTAEILASLTQAFHVGGLDTPAYRAAESRFRGELTQYIADLGYWDLLLMDTAGNVVFSVVREADLGTNLRTGPYRTSQLAEGFHQAITRLHTRLTRFAPYVPSQNRSAAFIVTPILKDNKPLGAMALQVDMSRLESAVSDRTGLGQSGETVLAQLEGDSVLFTGPLKRIPDAPFRYSVPFRQAPWPMQQALTGNHSHGFIRDYANVENIAAWRYLPALRWGMVVKIEVDEALAPAARLRRISYLMLALFLLISGGAAYFFGRRLTRPILDLTRTAESIAKGDLSQRAPPGGSDELGRMASAFNTMTDALSDARHNLELKVEERTRELLWNTERTNAILDNVLDGIITINEHGIIESFNHSAEQIFGYQSDEVIGKNIKMLMPEPYQSEHDGYLLNYKATGIKKIIGIGREVQGKRKDGSIFPMDLAVSEAHLHEQRAFIGSVRDITERKRAEESLRTSEARLIEAQHTAQIGNWDLDLASGKLYWSDETFNIFGIDKTAFSASYEAFLNAIHPEDRDRVNQIYTESVKNHKPYEIAHRLLMADGSIKWVNERCKTYYDEQGKPLRSTGTIQDITVLKHAEMALIEAKLAAEAASRAKSSFLANMSHEIRTPMNSILGLTQLVLESELNPQQKDYLRKAHTSSKALLGILNDILDYSKIEAGRMEVESIPIRLEGILQDVADLFSAQIEQKGLELFFEIGADVPFEVAGDPLRLMQVLNNLVGNAIKFTEQGEIHIKLEATQSTNNQITLRFAVRDTGIGLDKNKAEHLFQSFSQMDSSITRKYGGTGLGLAISQKLVKLMGGEITVSSLEGKGSTFSFTIQVGTLPSAKLDLQQIGGLKVLVVDDQETSRLTLKSLLEAWGLEAHIASSGAKALARLKEAEEIQQPFDAILLDWRMPEMSGLDVVRRVNEHVAKGTLTHPLIVLMVTAYSKEELLEKMDSIQVDGILSKPVTPSYLFDALLNARHPQASHLTVDTRKGSISLRFDGARILLVEDNALNQEVATAFLQRRGVIVTVANNGREAVEWVQRQPFDAVLTDLHMPDMDGFEATQRIHALPEGKYLPVIAMTAAVMQEDRDRCAAAGMVDFVAKPIDPDELVRCLKKWLKVHSEQAPEAHTRTIDATLPAHLPGFEITQALHRMDNNQALLARLLCSFAEEHDGTLTQLDALLQAGKNTEAATLLHTLKGVAANLGASVLANAAKQLEQEIKSGEKTCPSRPAFDAALKAALAAITTAFNRDKAGAEAEPATGTEIDRAALADLFNKLLPFLQDRELIPDELMQTLQQLALSDLPSKPLAQLIRQIDQFDHDGALSGIVQLAATLGLELRT